MRVLKVLRDRLCKLDTSLLRTDRRATDNTGFASGGETCKLGVFYFYSSSLQSDSLVLHNPPLAILPTVSTNIKTII